VKQQQNLKFVYARPLSRFRFLFTIFPGIAVTENLIFWLTALHFRYRKKIVLI